MTLERATGLLLIVMPVAFNLFFFLLGRRFDYPTILRQPTGEILRRFLRGSRVEACRHVGAHHLTQRAYR